MPRLLDPAPRVSTCFVAVAAAERVVCLSRGQQPCQVLTGACNIFNRGLRVGAAKDIRAGVVGGAEQREHADQIDFTFAQACFVAGTFRETSCPVPRVHECYL